MRAARITTAALVTTATLLCTASAHAQFVPDVPPFTPADPTLGRPFDRVQPGPYGDPSLSRQGPLATPHPMFRDPARQVIMPSLPPPPRVGAGLLPETSPPPRGARRFLREERDAVAPGGVVTLTQRKQDAPPPAVATLRDVARALSACWRPPQGAGAAEATVRVAFARDGTIVGAPRVTYVSVREPDLRASVRASALAAARACAPLRFTPAAASAIAGRIFAIRLIASP